MHQVVSAKEAQQRAVKAGHELYNITRMDYSKAKGWWVRVIKSRTQYSKLFSDGRYTDSHASLLAAIHYRDELLEKLYGSYTKYKKQRKSKNDVPKITGVTHNIRLKRNKYVEECWIASWVEHGKQRKKSFSVKKYGAENALKLAKEYREQKVSELKNEKQKAAVYTISA